MTKEKLEALRSQLQNYADDWKEKEAQWLAGKVAELIEVLLDERKIEN